MRDVTRWALAKASKALRVVTNALERVDIRIRCALDPEGFPLRCYYCDGPTRQTPFAYESDAGGFRIAPSYCFACCDHMEVHNLDSCPREIVRLAVQHGDKRTRAIAASVFDRMN